MQLPLNHKGEDRTAIRHHKIKSGLLGGVGSFAAQPKTPPVIGQAHIHNHERRV